MKESGRQFDFAFCGKRTSRLDEIPRKSWPEKNANQIQGIYYRDITLINLVNCKRIKKGTYIIDCIQLNTWRLNSVNESNIIKELINEPRATANTRYIYTNKDERACSKRDKQQNKRKQLTYQSLYAGGLKSHFIN